MEESDKKIYRRNIEERVMRERKENKNWRRESEENGEKFWREREIERERERDKKF